MCPTVTTAKVAMARWCYFCRIWTVLGIISLPDQWCAAAKMAHGHNWIYAQMLYEHRFSANCSIFFFFLYSAVKWNQHPQGCFFHSIDHRLTTLHTTLTTAQLQRWETNGQANAKYSSCEKGLHKYGTSRGPATLFEHRQKVLPMNHGRLLETCQMNITALHAPGNLHFGFKIQLESTCFSFNKSLK